METTASRETVEWKVATSGLRDKFTTRLPSVLFNQEKEKMAICALKVVFMSRSEYEQIKIDNDRKFEALKDKISELQHALDCKDDHCKMVEIDRERAYQRLLKQKNELEHRYEKVCKENRHLEAEIKRMKERR